MTSYRDWVVELSNTTGTGPYGLAGAPAGTSYFTLRQRYSNGEDKVVFWAVNADRTKWEKNRFSTLTYGTPDTLSRAVVESTNGDAAVSWVGGDLPLRLYVVPDSDAQQFAIDMGLGAARPDILLYGPWAKDATPSANFDQLNFYDGTSDDPIGVVNTVAHQATLYALPPGYIQGLTLSRPSTTTITAAAGRAMDSTNVVGIRLASAFTKSTAGAWAAGTGQNGMGNGLTIANSTWYHVFAILVAGVADVYLDTSITAANKPAGTTHFVLLESVKTNGSAQLLDFIQVGNKIEWVATPVADISATGAGASAVTRTLASVPTGRVVEPIISASLEISSAASEYLYLSALTQTDVVANTTSAQLALDAATANSQIIGPIRDVFTNTSAQIRSRLNNGAGGHIMTIKIHGWKDPRPRF